LTFELCRLEKSNLRTAGGMAKLVGTLTGIGGAMILTFYKGRKLCLWSSHIGLLHHAPSPHGAPTGSPLWGCILAFGAALTYSVWLIIQVQLKIAFNNFLKILQKVLQSTKYYDTNTDLKILEQLLLGSIIK